MNFPVGTSLMFFDVESIGLHGEGFAVGWLVVDAGGLTLESGLAACPPAQARGQDTDRDWVAQNVPPLAATHTNPKAVRAAFWARWRNWQAQGASLVTHVAWPVEARFLSACIDDIGPDAHWHGPYPLLDLATVLTAQGLDPTRALPRTPEEAPNHHPLSDAKHTARLWRESVKSLNNG